MVLISQKFSLLLPQRKNARKILSFKNLLNFVKGLPAKPRAKAFFFTKKLAHETGLHILTEIKKYNSKIPQNC